MKKNISLLMMLAGLVLTTACGSSNGSVLGFPAAAQAQENADQSRDQNENQNERSAQSLSYELSNDLQVHPVAINQADVASELMTLSAGTGISVLERQVRPDGTEMVRLGLEFDDETLAQDIWVTADEFNQAQLSAIEDQDPYDENGNEISLLDQILRKKMTYCYRYVKQYLLSHGMVDVYLPGGSAYMAATELPKHGFKKSGRKPSNAIVNDVCVYRGGPAGHGHIEILTAKGWYYGYGYKSHPIQNRIFIGCYHK